ncbi:splicing factor 3a subunit 3 (nucleomorph) [Lotharella oceanica]|uniref:Splicing factor 3a subunit 3 n=1 Tax=Lotharella oceanica TaxID=641309 RepID=A0A060DA77_9EUKA|nr:splicing factor 3a subunit 3 [Lotharella oceanica]
MMSKHLKIIKNEKKFFNSVGSMTNKLSLNSNIIKNFTILNKKQLKKKRNFLLFDLYYKPGKFKKFNFSKLNIELFNFYLEYLRNVDLKTFLSYSIFLRLFQNRKFLKLNLKKNINKKLLSFEHNLLNNIENIYYYNNPLILSLGIYNNIYSYFIKFIFSIFHFNIFLKKKNYDKNSNCILYITTNLFFRENKKEVIKIRKNISNYSFLYRKLIKKIKFIKLIIIFKEEFEKIIIKLQYMTHKNKNLKNTIKFNDKNIKNIFGQLYNPLKLPLGWDNKPIPYWLYKLHGLNEIFTCEICGNCKFHGRIAFERHFSETRHINGLRSLGIHYSKIYYEITTISKALELSNYLEKKKNIIKNF